MPRLWAKTTSFDSVSLGDELPILIKWETEQSIQRFKDPGSLLNEAEGTAAAPGDNAPVQLDSVWSVVFSEYVAELLDKGFKQPNIIATGSQLDLKIHQPVNLGDTLSISGSVVDKRVEQELRLVECRVIIENESGETVASINVLVSL